MHHLLRIASEGGEREISVDRDYLILGRDPSACHVLLDDDVVSRRHAALELDAQGKLTVVDLASTNGTFVNGAAVDRRALREGDTISLGPVGQVDMRYSVSAVAPAGEAARPTHTGERSDTPPAVAQTFVAPAETMPLADLATRRPPTVATSEQGQSREGRAAGAVCAACSSPLEAGGTFCPSCGASASQATTVACPRCGQGVGASAKFCKYCAHQLNDTAPGAAGTSYVSAPPQPVRAPAAAPQPTPPAPAFVSSPFGGVDEHRRGAAAESYISQSRSATVPQVGPTGAPINYAPADAPPSPAQHTTQAAGGGGWAWLTPTGAGISAICFFLPWMQFSCGGYSRSVSGADIASRDGSLWLIFVAALVILGAYFIFKAQRRLAASRPVTIITSLAAAALLLFKGLEFSQPQQTMFGRISAQDLGLSIQPGAFGALAGFLVALFGAAVKRGAPVAPAAPRAPMRDEVASALCYAAAPASVVLWFLGVPLLAIPVSYLLWVLAPLGFLLAKRHRANPALLVHAFQSSLLSGAFFLVALLRVMFVPGLNLEEYQPGHTVSSGFWQLLFLALIGAMVFLMHGAYTGKQLRAPVLTDFATKLAEKVRRASGA